MDLRRIKLPEIRGKDGPPFVLFQWNPDSPDRLIMLFRDPNLEGGESKHRIRLDHADDFTWILKLRNGQDIVDQAKMYGHLVYWPKSGQIKVIRESENEEKSRRFKTIFDQARRERSSSFYRNGRWTSPGNW